MDFIKPEGRIKSGKPGQKNPYSDSGKKIAKSLHGG
jgi:hypothetical protein